MGIVKTAVTKFRTTLLVMIFLIIMGTFGRAAMPIASNPNIQFPFVNISHLIPPLCNISLIKSFCFNLSCKYLHGLHKS